MPNSAKAFILMTVALQGRAGGVVLTAAKAYNLISLINLVDGPLGTVTAGIPSFMGGIGCFERIQKFLLTETKSDDRVINHRITPEPSPASSTIALQTITPRTARGDSDILSLDECSFGYSADALTIDNLTCTIKQGTINMVIGPVGSGKTSLILGSLGETQNLKGFVRMRTSDVTYCQQSAWLPNDTIKSIIIGTCAYRESCYKAVVFSCALEKDISRLTDRDDAIIGSRGLSLSGGQRQRLALARAVYAEKAIILLDDVFSALDAKTEKLVFERLLSKQGLFGKSNTTVVLATQFGSTLHPTLPLPLIKTPKRQRMRCPMKLSSLHWNESIFGI